MTTILFHLSKIAGICILLLVAWMIYSGYQQYKPRDTEDEWSTYYNVRRYHGRKDVERRNTWPEN